MKRLFRGEVYRPTGYGIVYAVVGDLSCRFLWFERCVLFFCGELYATFIIYCSFGCCNYFCRTSGLFCFF
ncbi:MAG: hypothetical protein LBJ00_14730 [Planctomycetaceae bacterium]|nr:hypothetical protein [Planctomycetaceae bacterium]